MIIMLRIITGWFFHPVYWWKGRSWSRWMMPFMNSPRIFIDIYDGRQFVNHNKGKNLFKLIMNWIMILSSGIHVRPGCRHSTIAGFIFWIITWIITLSKNILSSYFIKKYFKLLLCKKNILNYYNVEKYFELFPCGQNVFEFVHIDKRWLPKKFKFNILINLLKIAVLIRW